MSLRLCEEFTFQRYPHSLHKTNVVIGSSALRVCIWTYKHKFVHLKKYILYFIYYKRTKNIYLVQFRVKVKRNKYTISFLKGKCWKKLRFNVYCYMSAFTVPGCRCSSSSCIFHTAAGQWWCLQFWPSDAP